MKGHDLMKELEKSIEDKVERGKVLKGLLGFILTSTQVFLQILKQFPLSSLVPDYFTNLFVFPKTKNMQEAAVVPPYVGLAVRPNPGSWEYVKVNAEDLSVEGVDVLDYLKLKEMIFDDHWYVQSYTRIFQTHVVV